jgi:hypothetical protein
MNQVSARIPVFSGLTINASTGEVYADNAAVYQQIDGEIPGNDANLPTNARSSDAANQGNSAQGWANDNAGTGGAQAVRPRERNPENNVPRRTGIAASNEVAGAGVGGIPVNDTQLARYLSRLGDGFGRALGHGVGVTTLKRALITQAAMAGEVESIGQPGMLYSQDAAPPR